jgi:hypothetical protein
MINKSATHFDEHSWTDRETFTAQLVTLSSFRGTQEVTAGHAHTQLNSHTDI